VQLDEYVLPENTKTESKTYTVIAGFAPTITPMIQDFWANHWGQEKQKDAVNNSDQ
jgi:hypothetical protein